MAVEVAGIFEGPAHLVTLRKIVEQGALFRFVAVNLKAEHAEARIIQSTADNFESGELLGNEEHRFSPGEGGGNQVRYGLRFTRAWWALDDQILTAKSVHEGAVLR